MTEPLDEIANPAHFVPEFLSERQQQILQRICEGETIHDIARDLYISENTVKYHLKTVVSQY
ncbi:MAG TPA: LuxR C-terminal-related transcriptional regulator [bacterium]|nr:LuxR C-terminal-related transcriptional regulator [bacterium]